MGPERKKSLLGFHRTSASRQLCPLSQGAGFLCPINIPKCPPSLSAPCNIRPYSLLSALSVTSPFPTHTPEQPQPSFPGLCASHLLALPSAKLCSTHSTSWASLVLDFLQTGILHDGAFLSSSSGWIRSCSLRCGHPPLCASSLLCQGWSAVPNFS